MFDQGNGQLSAVGFFNPMLGGGVAVGASGGGTGVEGGLGVFDIEDGKVVRCALVFGRQWVKCDDTPLDILEEDGTPTGVIYAEIDHSSTSLTLSVKHNKDGELPENSMQKSYRALYYAYGSGEDSSTSTSTSTSTPGGTPPTGSWADVRLQPAMFAMN